jgi:hypothetical protein
MTEICTHGNTDPNACPDCTRDVVSQLTGRVVARFSCGIASAWATHLVLATYVERVQIVNAFIAEEDEDNRRFLADCERWYRHPIEIVRDTKYGASAEEVWRRKRFMVSMHGAPCSKALKRDVLEPMLRPDDILVLGYTADKRDAARLGRFIDANPERRVIAPLVEAGLTKEDCARLIVLAGLALPRTYGQGYPNGNCIGCVKGGEGYWNHVRVTHPAVYERRALLQDDLGPGSYFFRNRKTGERISLRMLDPNAGRFEPFEVPDCAGATCEMPDTWAQAVAD